jgi:hypothetical protein
MTVEFKSLRQLAKQQGRSLRKTRGGYTLRNIGKKNAGRELDSDSLDVIAFFLKGGQIDEITTACGLPIWKRQA